MAGNTKIEWTERTWNPMVGCSKVSPGCANCYAERLALRFGWTTQPWTAPHIAENLRWHADRLDEPFSWRKPQRVFVCSMSDLFHPNWSGEAIASVFRVMMAVPRHTFQVLTKRPERMWQWLNSWDEWPDPPPSHIWLGTSAEDQRRLGRRLPLLLMARAAVRFLSLEPLLGEIDLLWQNTPALNGRLHWVIIGGESGPKARPCDPRWIGDLLFDCEQLGVAAFVKQLGSRWAKSAGSPTKGGEMADWPEHLRVRQYPTLEGKAP